MDVWMDGCSREVTADWGDETNHERQSHVGLSPLSFAAWSLGEGCHYTTPTLERPYYRPDDTRPV